MRMENGEIVTEKIEPSNQTKKVFIYENDNEFTAIVGRRDSSFDDGEL